MPSDRVEEITAVLRRRLASGRHLARIAPGDRLPSVRDVAREFGVHQRVALAAYRELEVDGLVELRPRSGVYARGPHPEEMLLPRLTERLVEFLVDALELGVPGPEVPERVRRCLETLRLRCACIECNADQIASLCQQLGRDYGFESAGVELAALDTHEAPPAATPAAGAGRRAEASDSASAALRQADLLVTTTYHVDAVRRAAERLGKPWIAVSLRPDVVAEITRALGAAPVYVVGTDPRFATKLRTMFASVPGGANLRPLVVGRDDLAAVPADAVVYVMASARAALADHPVLSRIPPLARSLSAASARELFRFVVRANMAAVAALGAPAGRAGP